MALRQPNDLSGIFPQKLQLWALEVALPANVFAGSYSSTITIAVVDAP